jgi:hypothetical protein
MSRGQSGNFRAKHPPDVQIDATIMKAVAEKLVKGCMACKTAHAIATTMQVSPGQIGVAIDMHNGRIQACQLGLFGYGKVKTIAQGGSPIQPELKAAIQNALAEGRLSCEKAWRIAESEGMDRLAMGRACEMLGIKVNRCQLGAF